mmetsp:Transcript_103189/g.298543  ORF Transcript_103189/g.298543 Transcript_103189/m.298543 type:complete len:93 (-) Transcript_103189:552-830(-)
MRNTRIVMWEMLTRLVTALAMVNSIRQHAALMVAIALTSMQNIQTASLTHPIGLETANAMVVFTIRPSAVLTVMTVLIPLRNTQTVLLRSFG